VERYHCGFINEEKRRGGEEERRRGEEEKRRRGDGGGEDKGRVRTYGGNLVPGSGLVFTGVWKIGCPGPKVSEFG
jgi:hypothetical protein